MIGQGGMKMECCSALVRVGRMSIFTTALALTPGHLGTQGVVARGPANTQPQAARMPRAAAPKDLTGYWESVVTEYWRYRMVVPDKSDYVIVPLNAEGRKAADAWDPAKDRKSVV